MGKMTKSDSGVFSILSGNHVLRSEQTNPSRLLPNLVSSCWKVYGADQARVMLYTFGRIAGTELCKTIADEYGIDQDMNWNEFMESIEVLGKIFLKASVRIASSSENKVLIRVSDSPCCYKLTGFDQPCCDYLAGLFAAFGSYVFKGVETTCNEIACKATGYAQHCDFELIFDWKK